ncbi:MAG: HEAT repeat domain-containing protein [Candidatus Hydrogenedentes bacterium]|nr:HEAT repeat domain-containing protein [Candidatus Hydrogenedentota bacterium]
MNIEMFLASEWCGRVMLTMASFLWQGALLGVLAALAMLLLRRRSARLRYGVMVVALLLMAACPVLTYVAVSHVPETVAWVLPHTSTDTPTAPAESAEPNDVETAEAAPAPASPITPVDVSEMPSATALAQARGPERPWATTEQVVFLAYAAGVAAMLLRLGMGVMGGKRLRRRSRPVEESILLTTLAHSAQAFGMRVAPALAYCQHVAVPTVVGIVRPMILLPVSFASGLTPQQIEFLLLHELAHIRRFDHLVNIAQRLIEAFLFFHPAVWYVSRRIRFERELCCDDLVVKQGGEARAYAESLIAAATLACKGKMAPASLAALSATDNPSQLRRRVQRLLGANESRVRLVHGGWTISALMLVVAAIAVAQVNAPANNAQSVQSQTAEPAQEPNVPELAQLRQPLLSVEPAANPEAATESAQVAAPAQLPVPAANGQPSGPNVEAQIPASADSPAVPSNLPPASVPSGLESEEATFLKLFGQLKDKDWWLRKLAVKQIVEAKNARIYVPYVINALSDEDERVKAAAATALGQIGDPDAINHLVAALKNSEPVREAAAEALTKFPQEKVMPILRIAAIDEDESVYSGTVAALQRIDNPETIQLLVSLLPRVTPTKDQEDELTVSLRAAFGKKDANQVLAAFKEALQSPDKAMRAGVAQVLGPDRNGQEPEETQSAENLCRADETVMLLKGLATDADRNVRAAAVNALGGLADYRMRYSKQSTEEALAALAAALRDTNKNVAAMAGDLLSKLSWQPPTPEDKAYFLIAQGNATEAAKLGTVAYEPLAQALSRDSETVLRGAPAVRNTPPLRRPVARVAGGAAEKAQVIGALGQLSDERAIPALLEALHSADPDVVFIAAEALGERKEPRAVEPLLEMAKHPNENYRCSAVMALRAIGDPRAVPTLIAALNDSSHVVRSQAAVSLGELGDKQATPDLVRVALNDTDFNVRSDALNSIAALKDRSAIAPLAAALKETLAKDATQTDENARWQLSTIAALGTLGGPEACDALLPVLARFPNSQEVISALGDTGDQRAAGPIAADMIENAKDGDISLEVIETYFNALVKLGGPTAMTGIADFVVVMGERRSDLAALGFKALEKMQQPEAGNVIYDLVTTKMPPGYLQLEGAYVLARLGDERARDILEKAKEDPNVRAKVFEALQALNAAKAAKPDTKPAAP